MSEVTVRRAQPQDIPALGRLLTVRRRLSRRIPPHRREPLRSAAFFDETKQSKGGATFCRPALAQSVKEPMLSLLENIVF